MKFKEVIDNIEKFGNLDNLVDFLYSVLPENEEIWLVEELNNMLEDEMEYWD